MKKIIIAISMVCGLITSAFCGQTSGYVASFGILSSNGDGKPFNPYIQIAGESQREFRSYYFEDVDHFKILTALISTAITNGREVFINWDDATGLIRSISLTSE